MAGKIDSLTMNGKTFTGEPVKNMCGKTKNREKKE